MTFPVACLLSFATGSTDAMAFLGLGGVFASVMTGNLIVLGVSVGRKDPQHALHTGVALCGYAMGTLAGAWIERRVGARQLAAASRSILEAELVLLTCFVAVWEIVFGVLSAPGYLDLLPLVLSSACMGLQSCVARPLHSTSPSTTYFTGSLTEVLSAIGSGFGPDERRNAVSLLALVAGAVVGGVLVTAARLWAPAVGEVALIGALAAYRRSTGRS